MNYSKVTKVQFWMFVFLAVVGIVFGIRSIDDRGWLFFAVSALCVIVAFVIAQSIREDIRYQEQLKRWEEQERIWEEQDKAWKAQEAAWAEQEQASV